MPEKITTILKQFEAQGSFSARQTTDAEDLHIEIDSIGPLRFPLKPGEVKRMIKTAKPATFGWRDKTCMERITLQAPSDKDETAIPARSGTPGSFEGSKG